MSSPARVVALFAGIGGIELGLRRSGFETVYAVESWEPARAVLRARFPEVELGGDIRGIEHLPPADIVTAGFPCTDLSQAGRTAGIAGAQSGLVETALDLVGRHECTWLVLENVRNMLHLHGGNAMAAVTARLEELGFRWAYRVVDSRFTGVPQRRQRAIFVASRDEDPRPVLFSDDSGERPEAGLASDAFGFYWTEGLRGLGWARDAIPTLKGGSTIGIPSAPAIWMPHAEPGERFVIPGIEAGERLQGFRTGWTRNAVSGTRAGARWKLIGNAVTVGVSRWLGRRLREPGQYSTSLQRPLTAGDRWPQAAWGEDGHAFAVDVSMWPERRPHMHLRNVLRGNTSPLTYRAAAGFLSRLERSSLRVRDEFRVDLKDHVELLRDA